MTPPEENIAGWPDRLEAVAAQTGGRFRRVHVLRETASTQDAARRLGPRAGDVVTAGRQTAGRGRLGRAWADSGDAGVAITLVVEVEAPERLAPLAAVAVAEALEPLAGVPLGIKWPNDVLLEGRKLAGILIEVVGETALVGIGVNVGRRQWPPDLEGRAASLVEIAEIAERTHTSGVPPTRIEVLEALVRSIAGALEQAPEQVAEAWRGRDVLFGRTCRFRSEGRPVEGRVLGVEPGRGILVETGTGRVLLPAATTTVLAE